MPKTFILLTLSSQHINLSLITLRINKCFEITLTSLLKRESLNYLKSLDKKQKTQVLINNHVHHCQFLVIFPENSLKSKFFLLQYVCVCVYVCARTHTCVYVSVCVFVCVCVWEREREIEREREREIERERVRERDTDSCYQTFNNNNYLTSVNIVMHTRSYKCQISRICVLVFFSYNFLFSLHKFLFLQRTLRSFLEVSGSFLPIFDAFISYIHLHLKCVLFKTYSNVLPSIPTYQTTSYYHLPSYTLFLLLSFFLVSSHFFPGCFTSNFVLLLVSCGSLPTIR